MNNYISDLFTDPNSMLLTALVAGDVPGAVELCIRNQLWPEAFQLAVSCAENDVFR